MERKWKRIVYCYGSVWQPIFSEMGIIMHKGIPENVKSLFGEDKFPAVIVLDDLQSEIENSLETQQLKTLII